MESLKKRLLSQLSFINPRSYVELVIAGFSLVALPLLIAFVTGVFYVDKLTQQSQQALYRAVQTTNSSREIMELTNAMERSTRQFLVLNDSQLYKVYREQYLNYQATSQELSDFLVDEQLRLRLKKLDELTADLFVRMQAYYDGVSAEPVKAHEFSAMTELSQNLFRDTNRLIDSEMAILREISDKARNIIFWELAALVPGVIIFILVFVVLLSRPIRELEQGIKQIGEGRFDEEIHVTGPRDLVSLGTQLEWLRNRLKYLEEKKTKFLHYVSHELKTPLAAIREGSELLAEGVTGPLSEHQQEVADILKKNSISLQQMIEKLLSFNMPSEAGSDQLKELKLWGLIDTVVADHRPVLLAKHINLTLDYDKNLVMQGVEEKFRVIVDNLLSNAIKFTPENGTVSLQLRDEEGHVVLRVFDTGPGIDKDDALHVFDAFYRGKQQGAGVIRGSGLGLSIVKEFVEAHHGSIRLLQPGSAIGACFEVIFPRKKVISA
ncbi:MAG: ATP-binding protein [Gammaproteobacteria bacterium]|nr:ATP-binding protein [Gammaproteobacteria bacterium]